MATVNLFGDLALDASVQETNDKLDALTSTRDTTVAPDHKGILGLAIRRDTDSAPVVDGNMAALAMDEEGRLKTSNKTASFAVTSGSTNTVAATLVVDVRRASNVVFHLKNTGAVATGATAAFHFEASIDSTNGTDGTWFKIQAVRSNVNTIDTGTSVVPGTLAAGAGLTYSWESSVNAYQYMRIYCSVAPAATSNAVWTVQRGSYATEPIPAAQISGTQPISGSVTVSGAATTTPVAGTPYPPIVTTASLNAAIVKATAGSLYEFTASNPTATAAYVKFYNKATLPVPSTDVPVLTVTIPAAGADAGFKAVEFGAIGKRFSAGIGIAVVGGVASNDATNAVAGIQVSATYV